MHTYPHAATVTGVNRSRACQLVAAAVILTGCAKTAGPETWAAPPLRPAGATETDTSNPPEPSTPNSTTTSTTTTSTPTANPPIPTVTGTAASEPIQERHGFIAVRYDCQFVPDSPQQKWTQMRADTGLSSKPKQWQRYDAAQLAGAGYSGLHRFWKQSITAIPRVKAAVSGSKVTVWLTVTDINEQFDLDTAVTQSPHELARIMSAADGSGWGTCTIHPDEPLPPQHKSRPDDTGDWAPPRQP
jgi:hypothetical protein